MHPDAERRVEISKDQLKQRAFHTAVRCANVLDRLDGEESFVVTEAWLIKMSGMKRITDSFFRFLQQSMVKKGAFIAEITIQATDRRFIIVSSPVVFSMRVDPELHYLS